MNEKEPHLTPGAQVANLQFLPKRMGWIFALVLVAITALAYQPAWHGKPVWDDDAHLTSAELRSWKGLERIWLEPGATQQYYPLVHSIFWVEQKIWGDESTGYHFVNILLHASSALLLLAILRRLEIPGAPLAAAIFALHPVQVESVAWISELKNTLSGVFYLASALCYIRFDRDRNKALYAAALALFLAGLLCKTVIATLPAALLVIFWWKRGTLSWKRDALPLAPFFTIGAGMGVLTSYVEKKYIIGAAAAEFHLTLAQRCLIAGRAFWFYICKLAWPEKLTFIYPHWDVDPQAWWQWLFPLAALVLAGVLWVLRRKTRAPLAAVLFFAGTLFPALGFINIYPFRYSFVADHFQYLAAMGMVTLASAGAATVARNARGWQFAATQVAAVFVVTMLGLLTWRQCRMYTDAETLYRTTIERNPDCWMAYNNLGNILQVEGRTDEALVLLQKAVEISSGFAQGHYNIGDALQKKGDLGNAIAEYEKALKISPGYAEAHYNLGNTYRLKGDLNQAIAHYEKALELKPDLVDAHLNLGAVLRETGRIDDALAHFQRALEIEPGSAKVHNNLGLALLQIGKTDEATGHLQKAIAIDPRYAEAQNNLGLALLQRGRYGEAATHFQKALEINPGYADALYNLGLAFQQEGQAAASIASYKKALEIQPGLVGAMNNLAYLLATSPQESLREGAKALDLAQQANQVTGGRNPIVLTTLAAAYAETGQYSKAIETARNALNIVNAQNNTSLSGLLQSHLKLYQARTPLRDPGP